MKEYKKIVVFGFGVSGRAAVDLLINQNHEVLVVEDQNVEEYLKKKYSNVVFFSSKSFLEELIPSIDAVILSPGISRNHFLCKKFLKENVKIVDEIEYASSFLDPKIKVILVTGTNGKTTTVTMIASLFQQAKKNVFLGGNIGHPLSSFVLQKKKADFIVLELSSFQLESIENLKSDVSIILNIEKNHAERYKKFENYFNAKIKISHLVKEEGCLIAPKVNYLESCFQLEKERIINLDICNKSFCLNELKNYNMSSFQSIANHDLKNLCFVKKFKSFFKSLVMRFNE